MTRWQVHVRADGDGLVHHADQHYLAKFVSGHPEMFFTDCGTAFTWDGVRARDAEILPVTDTVTCVQCASGSAAGRARREGMKRELFGIMYSLPPGKVVSYAADDAAMTLALLGRMSLLRRCRRLAATLYSTATGARRA